MLVDFYDIFGILFQKNGIERNLGIGKLLEHEAQLLKKAMPELHANIKKGEDFSANN